MSSREEQQIIITIPLFLKKLWKMVNDKNAENIIGWNDAGDGFIIYDQVRFITELLPLYFKHNNLASFVRQLNFYDFHKVANIPKNEMEFAHPYFLKGLPETLSFITRKCSNIKSKVTSGVKEEDITEVLSGVKDLKSKHHLVDNELQLLKQENAALWSEVNSLRVKYSKQTKIINKLIHFLISYIHSHQNTFSKPNVAVTRKHDLKNLKNSPKLLQIGYVNAKKGGKNKLHNFINEPSSSETDMYGPSSIDSLLQETSEDPFDSYTVSYPDKYEEEPLNTNCPIEEIVSEADPLLAETSTYIVKFPKSQSQIANDTSSLPVGNSQGKALPNKTKRQCHQTPVARNFTVKTKKHSLDKGSLVEDVGQKVSKIPKIKKVQVEEDIDPLNDDMNSQDQSSYVSASLDLPNATGSLDDILPIVGTVSELNMPEVLPDMTVIEGIAPEIIPNVITSPEEILLESAVPKKPSMKVSPPVSRNKMKLNIMENPKENLGLYLDNTQLQLNNLQDILNNMNSKEISELASCFNVAEEEFDTNGTLEKNNLNLISKELEEELSKLPAEVSNSEPGASNQICTIIDPDLDNFEPDVFDEYLNTDFQ